MTTATAIPSGRKQKAAIWLAVVAGVALVIGANAHLVYVAVTSQPDCIAHRGLGESGDAGTFSAAESACTPAGGQVAAAQHSE